MNAPLLEIRSDAHFVGFVHSERAASARLRALRVRLAVSLVGADREAIVSPTFVLARRGASGWRVCSVRSVDRTSVELWTVGSFDSDSPRIELSCATVRLRRPHRDDVVLADLSAAGTALAIVERLPKRAARGVIDVDGDLEAAELAMQLGLDAVSSERSHDPVTAWISAHARGAEPRAHGFFLLASVARASAWRTCLLELGTLPENVHVAIVP
jgi:hypothetical protein